MMKKLSIVLFAFGSILISSCSDGGVLGPIDNKFNLNNLTFKIKHAQYHDFGHHFDRNYHNMEFYLGDITVDQWKNCNTCYGAFLRLDIYNEDPVVPTDYLYRIEKKETNQISCHMYIRDENGSEASVKLISGTVEIIGETLENIRIEIEAKGDLGQEIKGSYKGSLEETDI